MIVNATPEGWEIVFQRAHGLLAVQLAHQWRKDQRPEKWVETLDAIAEHDDSQEPLKGKHHISKEGSPLDFTLQEFSLQQAINVSTTAKYKSRWIALLISRHMSFLYERLRGNDITINNFLDNQITAQNKWIKELNVTAESVQKAYNLLRWCDKCSLILTKKELPENEKAIELEVGTEGVMHTIIQKKDLVIGVTPWPFENNQFEAWTEFREIKISKFKNDEELALALEKAAVNVKKWIFKKN